jgi:hypothetical protein
MTRTRISSWIIALAAALVGLREGAAQTVIYVNGSLASGANSGQSWTDAYRGTDGLHLALDRATQVINSGSTASAELWIAIGTYKPSRRPNPADPRSAYFALPSTRVSLFGGFAGTEQSRSQRSLDASLTVLDADLNGDDLPNQGNRSDNCYRVLVGLGLDSTCRLDGLTIKGARNDQPEFAGIPGSGGGLSNNGGDASPIIRAYPRTCLMSRMAQPRWRKPWNTAVDLS